MSGILRLESLAKGNTLKQGDKTPLKYRLFDADGEKLNIAGKSAKVRLVYPDFLTIGYEKDGLTVAQDDTVTFTIDKVIPAKLYHVEIIVDDQFIFPSREDESKFTVDKSSLGTEANIIEIVGVDAVVRKAVDLINEDPNLIIDEEKLVNDIIANTGIGSIEEYYQQFNDVIKELSEEKDYHSLPEIVGARRGYSTLAESLGNLSVNMVNKNLGKLDQTFMTDEFLQQIAGNTPIHSVPAYNSITNSRLTNHAVTQNTTTFAKKGKNLFSGYYENIQVSGGVPNGTATRQDGAISAVLQVQKNQTYRVSFDPESLNDRFRLAASIGYPEDGSSVRITGIHDALNSVNIAVSGDEDYIIIYLASPKNGTPPINFQIEQRTYQTSYESPHKVAFDFIDESISHRALQGRFGFINGFSGDFDVSLIDRKIITKSNGKLQYGNNRIDLKNGEFAYTGNASGVAVCINGETKDIIFVPSSEINNEGYDKLIILGYINFLTNDVNIFGFYTLEGKQVKPYTGSNSNGTIEEKPYIADKVRGSFISDTVYTEIYQHDHTILYAIYDDLVARYPDYVTKTEISVDESGFPVYRYDFKPHTSTTWTHAIPKIVFTSGVHGHEVSSIYATATFFKELVDKWTEKEVLRMLRWNIHFVVVPLVNPWGFENATRKNFNGVDLNRNFPTGWTYNSDTTSQNYAGESPLSEVGSQIMNDIISNETDVIMSIDSHNFGDESLEGSAFYMGTNRDKRLIESSGQYILSHLNNYFTIPAGVTPGFYLENPPQGSLVNEWNEKGILLETKHKVNGSKEEGQKFICDAIGNLILSVVYRHTA